MSGPLDAREFRRRLDEVLRRRDPVALRDFLIAAGQWQEGAIPADLDRALWMMIAASAALSDLHGEAERWLLAHGFEQEARAILGRSGAKRRGGPPPAARDGGRQQPGRRPPGNRNGGSQGEPV
jgi:hypothetical protein